VVNLKGLMMILELHQQGLSVSAIAERTGHDRKTVRKMIARGLVVPKYAPRLPRPTLLDPYRVYLHERVAAWPELSGARLLREVRERGYAGGITQLNDFVRSVRPPPVARFEVRFETPAGRQAQVDFAHFAVEFDDNPGVQHRVWLFAMVLGHSRYLWAQYVMHQDLGTVLRCHMQAFEHFGGAPREILYDRMKTAVLGEPEDDSPIVYNAKLVALRVHYGFTPRACQPYRAKTKGKVERPYRYIRADFFMARRFANLEDMNRQLRLWLDTVANARVHATTGRIVAEHLTEERPSLQRLPAGRFDAVLRIERRVSHEGMVSVCTACPMAPAVACWRSRAPPPKCASTKTSDLLPCMPCCMGVASVRCCLGIGRHGARPNPCVRCPPRRWCVHRVTTWRVVRWTSTRPWPSDWARRCVWRRRCQHPQERHDERVLERAR
jgi:transposase